MRPSHTARASPRERDSEFISLNVVVVLDDTCPSLLLRFQSSYSGLPIGSFPIVLGPSVYNVRIDDQSSYGISFKEPANAQTWYNEQSQNKHFGSLFQYPDPTRHTVWISRQMSWAELQGKLPNGLPDSSSDGDSRPRRSKHDRGHDSDSTSESSSHRPRDRRRYRARLRRSHSSDMSDDWDPYHFVSRHHGNRAVDIVGNKLQRLADRSEKRRRKASRQRARSEPPSI